MTKQLIVIMAVLGAFAVSARAISLGTDITIADNDTNASNIHWDTGTDPGEDEEIEPGSSWSQQWDLENMFVNASTLTLVGGYDFENGVTSGTRNYTTGDIFIDVDGSSGGDSAIYGSAVPGTVQSGNGNLSGTFDFGYEYALVPNTVTGTYDVYAVDGDMNFTTAYFEINEESNPWRLDTTGLTAIDSGSMIYYDTTEFGTDFAGDASNTGLIGAGAFHNAWSLDLSGLTLPNGDDLLGDGNLIHYTYGCGNDAMMGRVAAVPDGGVTLALLGCALFALEGLRRKVRR